MKIKTFFIILSILTVVMGAAYVKSILYQLSEGSKSASQSFDLSTDAGRANHASRIKTAEEFAHWKSGDKLMSEGRYELAIAEYIQINKYGRMEWESRINLADAYLKAQRYRDALRELDWITSQKIRPDVLSVYVKKRDEVLQQMQQSANGKFQ